MGHVRLESHSVAPGPNQALAPARPASASRAASWCPPQGRALGNRPCPSRAPVPPVLSGRDQASATPSIAISRQLTDRNAPRVYDAIAALHDCLFYQSRRRGEFLRSPDQVATAWNSAVISPTGWQ